MKAQNYKKYMKKDVKTDNPLIKIFIISFFGMLLVFTFIIKSFTSMMSVDTSIGDYQEQKFDDEETKKVVDGRLKMIQSEDQGRNFSDLMANPEDTPRAEVVNDVVSEKTLNDEHKDKKQEESKNASVPAQDPMYRVYVGSYTSAEQAKVAKDIILESGNGLNPIVKCIGSNNYTLQVGTFKNKQSAETMLYSVQQNHLPGRIVQEY